MKKLDLELVVGVFMIVGLACLAWLSIRLGSLDVVGFGRYELKAAFSNTGGLKAGSTVAIAGVEIGRVKRIVLEDYRATVTLAIQKGVEIPEDTTALIKTRGLIGEMFIEIAPGGSEKILKPGDSIENTQPAIDLMSLIAKYIFTPSPGGK